MRRGCLGAYPALVLNEWCAGIDLPTKVAHWGTKELLPDRLEG
jgi:hypothetical protein